MRLSLTTLLLLLATSILAQDTADVAGENDVMGGTDPTPTDGGEGDAAPTPAADSGDATDTGEGGGGGTGSTGADDNSLENTKDLTQPWNITYFTYPTRNNYCECTLGLEIPTSSAVPSCSPALAALVTCADTRGQRQREQGHLGSGQRGNESDAVAQQHLHAPTAHHAAAEHPRRCRYVRDQDHGLHARQQLSAGSVDCGEPGP